MFELLCDDYELLIDLWILEGLLVDEWFFVDVLVFGVLVFVDFVVVV